MHKRGFTLIELLIVIAITAIIFALSAPFALNFYHTQLINEAQSNIVSALERARHNAILQKNDSNFGVHFESGKYVIFQGDAYDVNDVTNNEEYPVVSGITFTGETDIIFSKLSGVTATTSTTTITYGNIARGIIITDTGIVSQTSSVVVAPGEEVILSSSDKTYASSVSPSESYPDTGGIELTDGTLGSSVYSDEAWQGFLGVDPDIVVDLASAKSLDHVRFHYLIDIASGIDDPGTLVVSGSNDNVDFIPLGTFASGADWSDVDGSNYWSNNLAVTGSYRYIKFAFTFNTQWLFLDELEVYAN